jgi:hypothetical protein
MVQEAPVEMPSLLKLKRIYYELMIWYVGVDFKFSVSSSWSGRSGPAARHKVRLGRSHPAPSPAAGSFLPESLLERVWPPSGSVQPARASSYIGKFT